MEERVRIEGCLGSKFHWKELALEVAHAARFERVKEIPHPKPMELSFSTEFNEA
jgi:hypothetical protein